MQKNVFLNLWNFGNIGAQGCICLLPTTWSTKFSR